MLFLFGIRKQLVARQVEPLDRTISTTTTTAWCFRVPCMEKKVSEFVTVSSPGAVPESVTYGHGEDVGSSSKADITTTATAASMSPSHFLSLSVLSQL